MDSKNVSPMSFISGSVQSNAPIASGVVSLEQFTQSEVKLKSLEELKRCGLSEEEIKIYNDYQKGTEHLESVYKNHEKTSLLNRISDIDRRIKKTTESDLKAETIVSIDPIYRLNEIKEDIFGHLEVGQYPTVNKRRKLMRRMERKLNKEALLPEPTVDGSQSSSKTGNDQIYNNFMKQIEKKIVETTDDPNSKWDKKVWDSGNVDKNNLCKSASNRQIGCSEKATYTIRNNKIVKLLTNKESYKESIESESRFVNGTKLNLEDIKSIPKFKHYDPGVPAKVLFLKNLSNHIEEKDLEKLFYDRGYTSIRVMSGKMKGQAFVTFDTIAASSIALKEVNGSVVKGKPIIINFSKHTNK